MLSGIVNITLYPLLFPIAARAIPVFPLVGSTIMFLSFVELIVYFSMLNHKKAGLSFILPAGLFFSSLTKTLPGSINRDKVIIGVLPIEV